MVMLCYRNRSDNCSHKNSLEVHVYCRLAVYQLYPAVIYEAFTKK